VSPIFEAGEQTLDVTALGIQPEILGREFERALFDRGLYGATLSDTGSVQGELELGMLC
jgi:hypothetical protein